MKIIDNRSCKIMKFCEIKQGGCFMYRCHLYLKTGDSTALYIENGVFSTFNDKEEVTPVSVVLTIEDYEE